MLENDALFKIYFRIFILLYEEYSGEDVKPGESNYMSRGEFKRFCADVNLFNDYCCETSCDIAFN